MNAVVKQDRAAMAADALKLVERAVIHVKVYHPFFGALISKLRLKVDWRHPTMYTDAVVIGFNPEFVLKQQWEHLIFILVHETEHCALRHPFRRGNRNPEIYNEAADHVVNLALLADPMLANYFNHRDWQEPDQRFKGMAVEQVYAIIESERAPQPQQDEGEPKEGEEEMPTGGSGMPGDCCDAGASGEPLEEEQEEEQSKPGKNGGKPQKGDSRAKGAEQGGSEEASSDDKTEPDDGGADSGDAGTDPECESGAGDDEESADKDGEGDEGDEANVEAGEDLDEETDDGEQAPQGSLEVGDGDGTLSPAQLADLEAGWSEAVTTAVLACGGEMGEGQLRALGSAGEVRRSFEEYMEQFAQRCFATEESWKRPNRRFSDAYLPSRSAPAVQELLVGVDTSGSISDKVLADFEAALQKIADDFKCAVRVCYCDTKISSEQHFQQYEPIKLEPTGGGGTRFSPVFNRAVELMEEGVEIAGVCYLTDLEGHVDGWRKFEHIETLWVSTNVNEDYLIFGLPPFGTVCSIYN